MKRSIFGLGIIIFAGFLIAGCGGDDDDSKTSAPTGTQTQSGSSSTATAEVTDAPDETTAPDGNGSGEDAAACALLTSDEVSAAVSEDMTIFSSADHAPTSDCEWDNASETTAVYVTVFNSGSSDGAEAEYSLLDENSEPVDGLGEKAHWVDGLDILEVLRGENNLEVQVVDFKSGSDPLTEARGLAEIALGRLP